ncbi:MAG: tyrosine-type recombinase/integrase [Rectinemataceae bacterium]|nr:tyrosine-type recombinase/integrase [Rectinemataceae bacterium]
MYQELDKAISTIISYYREQEIAASSRKSVSKACRDFKDYLVANRLPYSPGITRIWLSKQHDSPSITHSRQRACALIDAVLKTGAVPKGPFRYVNLKMEPANARFAVILETFLKEKAKEGKAESTMAFLHTAIVNFLRFLESRGIEELKELTPQLVSPFFVMGTHAKTPSSKQAYAFRIRQFIQYLARQKIVSDKLEYAIPTRMPRIASIVTTLSDEQVEEIQDYGKQTPTIVECRDRAIGLLALRLGLRAIDICNLKFGDISWDNREISLIQRKTGKPLILPLPTDVGNAVSTYILEKRPRSNLPYIFLTNKRPYARLGNSGCARAGGRILKGRSKDNGLHIFRRTCASRLLKKRMKTSVITAILGHSSVERIDHYLSTDEAGMRKCALDLSSVGFPEVLR